MKSKRDYNAEMEDSIGRKYTYSFDFDVMHPFMIKAFEPFFTAKNSSGRHIGTGLSRAQQVVADHGGIIDLEESPSGGCAAVVEFRLDGDPI